MQPWDSAIIKTDSNHPDKGRAGQVVAVEKDLTTGALKTVLIRLDETQDGKPVKNVQADAADVTRLG